METPILFKNSEITVKQIRREKINDKRKCKKKYNWDYILKIHSWFYKLDRSLSGYPLLQEIIHILSLSNCAPNDRISIMIIYQVTY